MPCIPTKSSFAILLVCFFLPSTVSWGQEKSNFITKIDFGIDGKTNSNPSERNGSDRKEWATYSELKVWAFYQGWNLDEDGSFYGLKNNICQMIPPEGWSFLFLTDPRVKERHYLYLDITRYRPGQKQILRPQVLTIQVNRRVEKRIEIVGRKNFENPVVLELDPADFPDGRIQVELIPSSPARVGKFWGLWDAFLVRSPL